MFSPSPLAICALLSLLSSTHSSIVRPVMPSQYIIEIKTDLENGKFSGKVVIAAKCEIPTTTISLNALKSKLKIDEEKVIVVDQRDLKTNLVEKAHWGPVDEVYLIETKKTLQFGGFYTITVLFEGDMVDGVQDGYFRIKDDKGYIAANQFLNSKARSGFPCFDEPFLKAEFLVILHRKENEKTFSSMTLDRTTDKYGDEGWKTDEYIPTVKLSPHLVAYAVTNIPLKSTPDCKEHFYYWYKEESKDTEIAANFACGIIRKQASSFAAYYSLPPLDKSISKIDVLLHPQFESNYNGGWGLLLSRETPRVKTTWDISDQYLTYARVASQYFGGIVSYDSEISSMTFNALNNYLTNELLANDHYSYVADNLLFIDGGMLTNQFVGEFDPYHYKWRSQSFHGNVGWDSQLITVHDIMLIRMMHYTIGHDVFKNTLRSFYNTYKYGYASSNAFWKTFNWEAKPLHEKLSTPFTNIIYKIYNSDWWGKTSLVPQFYKKTVADEFVDNALFANLPFGVNIENVLSTWAVVDDNKITQFKYPVIRVKRSSSIAITVTQEDFQGNWVLNEEAAKSSRRWWIPLSYTTSGRPNFIQTTPAGWIGPIHGSEGIKLYGFLKSSDWVIFNIQHVGVYRVQYELRNWDLLIAALNNNMEYKKIHFLNRVQLLRDALDFGFLGELPYDYVFRLLHYLQHEENTTVWRVFFQHIQNLESAIRRTTYYGNYQKNMKTLLTTLYKRIFPGKEWTDIYGMKITNGLERNAAEFYLIVLKHSFTARVDDMITMCRGAFNKWKSEDNLPTYNNLYQQKLITLAIATSLATGNDDDFQFVFHQYLSKLISSTNEDESIKIYSEAFQYTTSEASIEKALDWVFSADSSKAQEKKSEQIRIFGIQPMTFTTTLRYIYDNFEKVKTNTNNKELKAIIRMFALEMKESELAELEKFVNGNPELSRDEDIKEILKQGYIGDKRRRDWLHANVESLEEGLAAWQYSVKSK